MNGTLHVVIRQKNSLVWQGEADSLSSINQLGIFDILPLHANFIGLIEKHITIRTQKDTKKWPIDRGIISVKENVVEVYLGY